jgi:hypothetical protein
MLLASTLVRLALISGLVAIHRQPTYHKRMRSRAGTFPAPSAWT